MEVKELRIGNYVISKEDEDNIMKVNGITQNFKSSPFEIECIDNTEEFFMFKLEYLNPIPLTEEWLLKFGFTERSFKGYNRKFYKTVNNILFVIPFCISFDSINYYYPVDEEYQIFINLKYVHQLQNLYFSLTGEELTLK